MNCYEKVGYEHVNYDNLMDPQSNYDDIIIENSSFVDHNYLDMKIFILNQ